MEGMILCHCNLAKAHSRRKLQQLARGCLHKLGLLLLEPAVNIRLFYSWQLLKLAQAHVKCLDKK